MLLQAEGGRQYTNLRRLFAPVADDIDYICENGNLVICHGEICYKQTIERGYGAHLMRELMAIDGCEVLLSGVEAYYIQPKDPEYVNICVILLEMMLPSFQTLQIFWRNI
ncbi:MAG: hypothetical protein MR896_08850 [Clostridiales bacterium]|nr:hypothetical protein [Clostridiales bacterium]